MSGGHLCEAEAPIEATAETSAPPEENEKEINGCPRYEIYCKTVGAFIGRPLFYVKNIRLPPPSRIKKIPPRHLFRTAGGILFPIDLHYSQTMDMILSRAVSSFSSL